MRFENSNRRLAKNTAFLYVRMFLSMAISLYTSRITLQYLGVENYGIYNVVGGAVSFVTIISAAFTNSTQRFFALALGKRDETLLRKYFITIQNIHILLGIVFFLVAEIISYWLIEQYLLIPEGRIGVAYVVYHLSVLTMFFSLVTIPYTSLLIAAEHLSVYAYIGIGEQIVKLAGLLALIYVVGDPLILYASFMFGLSFFVRSIYSHYSSRHFSRTVKYKFRIDHGILRDIWSFVSWAYLGSFSGIAKEQGVNIVIGHFFGVTINAARGVSMQVYNAVTAFGNSFISALRPQIVKSYGAGEIEHALNLTAKGVKITFFLMYIIVLPLIIECPFVLSVWLKEVPFKAVIFTRLVLILCVLRTFQDPISTLYLAIGKIKKSQILAALYSVVCLISCMLVFALGAAPEISVWISMLIEIANFYTVCYLLSDLVTVNWGVFLKQSLFPIAKVLLLTAPVLTIIVNEMEEGIVRFFFIVPSSIFLTTVVIYFAGLDNSERSMFVSMVQNKFRK